MSIPQKIINGLIEGIKGIFIPDENYFTDRFSDLQNTFTAKMGYDLSFMESLKSTGGKNLDDIEISIMGTTSKIVNFQYLNTALTNIRPWIQSFIYFMLALFHINSIYKMIRGTNLIDISNTVSNMKGE